MTARYTIENVDEILGYGDYQKDFEELAAELCKPAAESMALSVFQEFTADMECCVYLDGEQTKSRQPIRFLFDIAAEDGAVSVHYAGCY